MKTKHTPKLILLAFLTTMSVPTTGCDQAQLDAFMQILPVVSQALGNIAGAISATQNNANMPPPQTGTFDPSKVAAADPNADPNAALDPDVAAADPDDPDAGGDVMVGETPDTDGSDIPDSETFGQPNTGTDGDGLPGEDDAA